MTQLAKEIAVTKVMALEGWNKKSFPKGGLPK